MLCFVTVILGSVKAGKIRIQFFSSFLSYFSDNKSYNMVTLKNRISKLYNDNNQNATP